MLFSGWPLHSSKSDLYTRDVCTLIYKGCVHYYLEVLSDLIDLLYLAIDLIVGVGFLSDWILYEVLSDFILYLAR